MRRALLAALVATAALVVLPQAAGAEATTSAVTSPTDGYRVTSIDDTTQVTVSGTSSGGAVNDVLSLSCFTRAGKATGLGTATITSPAGAFSGTAYLSGVKGSCVLRALPASFKAATGNPAPFTGPLITVEAQRVTTISDGPSAGAASDLGDWLQQSAAGAGLCSLGSFGVCGGRLFDAGTRASSEVVFNAGGWIGSTTGTRSYLQVDGVNAYPPYRAAQLSPSNPGIPSLTRTTARDARGGAASVVETDPTVSCNTTTFPPGSACTAFSGTGVSLERTSTVSTDGTTITQHDVLVSTDGKAHTVSAYLGENFLIDAAISPALRFGWVPGDASAVRASGAEIGGSTKGPATIYIAANAAAPDGDSVFAQGAVTFDRPVAGVRVTAPTDLLVRFPDVAVPAAGRADLVTSTYNLTRTAAEAAARATALEAPLKDRANLPTVAFTTPKAGATVLTPTITVVGTASDDQGIASLTVGGQPVAVSPSGRFSAAVPMAKGANLVTAIATDHAGNTATATLKLNYADRLAPVVGPLYIEPKVWRAGRSTNLRFALGESGTMRLTAVKAAVGRRRNGVCVASTPALQRARATVCTRYVTMATSVAVVQAPGVTTTIGPKFGGRVLKPGRYTLRVTVSDYARNTSKVRSLPLTLKPALGRTAKAR